MSSTFIIAPPRAGLRAVVLTETKSVPSTYLVSNAGAVSETRPPAATTNASNFLFGT